MKIKEAIDKFLLENSELSKARFYYYKKVCEFFLNFLKDKKINEVEEITNDLIAEFIVFYNNKRNGVSEWTAYVEKRIFKKLIRWLVKKYGLKVDLDIIKIKKVKNNYPIDLISEEEFKLIYNNSEQPYKTIFAILYEIGLRPQEVLNIKASDVLIGKDGIVRIKVKSGKTGERIVPIIWFARDVIEIYEQKRNNPNEKLFDISYETLRLYFRKLLKKLNINKKLRLYSFRHTALTRLAKKVPESILREIAGWTKDSDMPEVYIHLSQRDIEEKLLVAYGIKKEEEEKSKECYRCKHKNPSFATYCLNCGTPLSEEILANTQKELIEEDRILMESLKWIIAFRIFAEKYILSNSQLKKEFEKILKDARSLKEMMQIYQYEAHSTNPSTKNGNERETKP